MREIRAETLKEDARREARNAIERLNTLNQRFDTYAPIVEPKVWEGAFAVLYARFVSRWNIVKP
jgi:hypothetical protein